MCQTLWKSDDAFSSYGKKCRGCRAVIIPTALVDFSERSSYRARIAFLWGAMAISKIDVRFFISSLIGLKLCTRLEGENAQNPTDLEFWISSPRKFGAPLNVAFALRPIGRKISNRLYSSFRSCFAMIFSHIHGRRCKSLTLLFREFKFFLTFFSILCLLRSLQYLCNPWRWNFYTPCTDDGAN